MKRIINGIRSVLFNLAFYGFTIVYCSLYLVPVCLAPTDRPVRNGILFYCKGCLFLARTIMGIRYEFRGLERLPKEGAYIFAAAHQSYMDPILNFLVRKDLTALAKKELFSTPLIGTILRKARIVRIDRQSSKAHKEMNQVAQHVVELARPLIIYPQATRVPVGQRRKLKAGAYFLQQDTGLKVFPIATNTGLFWTKGFWHRPGTAVFEVQPEMPHDLTREAFMEVLEDRIVKRSDDLMADAGYAALLPKPVAQS